MQNEFDLVICFIGSAACNPFLEHMLTVFWDPRFFFSEWDDSLIEKLLAQQELDYEGFVDELRATRDAAGFCEREALACQSGEEIMIRLATGIRDLAAGFLAWAEDEKEIGGSTTEEEEYRPLKNYTGTYPILPEARPVRRDIM